eukprot:350472-Chlamydomonas_euryale.AAC.1
MNVGADSGSLLNCGKKCWCEVGKGLRLVQRGATAAVRVAAENAKASVPEPALVQEFADRFAWRIGLERDGEVKALARVVQTWNSGHERVPRTRPDRRWLMPEAPR